MGPIFESMDAVSNQARKAMESNDCETMGLLHQLVDINHHLLNACGVGHEAFEVIREITMKHGLPSKITGAGGGGCAFTILPQGISVFIIF